MPAGMFDPAPHKEIAARHPIHVEASRIGDDAQDFIARLGRATLIGIEAENPVMGTGCNRVVAQIAKTLERHLYDAGAKDAFDILAAHAYGWTFAADAEPGRDSVNWRRVELLREIMVQNGDGDKQVMITEGGWNDHPRWTRAVRPGQRIAQTLRAYTIAADEWPWLDAVCLWVFRFPWDQNSYQDYFTFVRTDFEPKPIYDEVRRFAQGDGS